MVVVLLIISGGLCCLETLADGPPHPPLPTMLQAEASQAALERRAEELNAAELRVRELQVGVMAGAGVEVAGGKTVK